MTRLISPLWPMLTIAFVAATTFGASRAAAVNLLANPGFETGGGTFTGWTTFGNGVQLSLPAGENIIRTGVAASKIFGEYIGCPDPSPSAYGVGGYFQSFAPTAGMVYTFSGYTYIKSTDPLIGTDTCTKNRAIAKIAFFNAVSGGGEIAANEIVIGDGNSITDQWNSFTLSAPVPTGALRVETLILYLQPECDNGSVFVDDLSFESNTPAAAANVLVNPSFSTDLSGWTTFGNVFRDSRAHLVRTPSGSAKLFSTFTLDSPSGLFQSFAAARATAWELSAWGLNSCRESPLKSTNDNYVTARIVFKNAANTEIGSREIVLVDKNSPVGTWRSNSVIALAPDSTATVEAYILFISPTIMNGAAWVDDISFRQLDPTGVPNSPTAPASFLLHQNVPNPFNPATRIDFELQQPDVVDLTIFDVAGRRIRTLMAGSLGSGPHSVSWDGKSTDGGAVANGIYRYILTTTTGRTSRSMVLAR